MTDSEMLEQFNKSVRWLRSNVGHDDIYEFAEQAVMAAECFLLKLHENIDLLKEMEKDQVFGVWVTNVANLRMNNASKKTIPINTEMKRIEDICK